MFVLYYIIHVVGLVSFWEILSSSQSLQIDVCPLSRTLNEAISTSFHIVSGSLINHPATWSSVIWGTDNTFKENISKNISLRWIMFYYFYYSFMLS
jgi:hypothetical protein